jgi:hypothetical protein
MQDAGASGEAAPAKPDSITYTKGRTAMKRTMFVAIAILAIILGIVAYATADTGNTGTPATVTVGATVNAHLSIELDKSALTFVAIDPGTTSPAQVVTVTVKSNKPYSLEKTFAGDWAAMGLATTLVTDSDKDLSVGSTPYPDTYTVNFPYTTDPTSYSANVQYTAAQ